MANRSAWTAIFTILLLSVPSIAFGWALFDNLWLLVTLAMAVFVANTLTTALIRLASDVEDDNEW